MAGNRTAFGACCRDAIGLSNALEAEMTGILDKFYVEHGIHGARVRAHSNQLTGYCVEDSEIDEAIQMLKDDLDACARDMKRLVELNSRGSLFEGWPSARDDILEA
jgi:hypothetical protein